MLDRRLRDRYSRQTIFPPIGEAGQVKLLAGTAVIIGCGALGCNIAMHLARMGVGNIRIVDRDFPEYHNLQRQVLFTEDDVKSRIPKAIAAERYLSKVNSTIKVEGIVADANYTNIENFCAGADVILDGLDNLETRLLINDVALKHSIPWVYGGAIASTGMTMTVMPGQTACLRCIVPVPSASRSLLTCETAGVVGTMPAIIGALQATEALKLLIGSADINRKLLTIDIWKNSFLSLDIRPRPDCPACQGRYEMLESKFDMKVSSLCGQSRSVQILSTATGSIDLDQLAVRLQALGDVQRDEYKLTFSIGEPQITVFPDGRAIIRNTVDEASARALYQKYVLDMLHDQKGS